MPGASAGVKGDSGWKARMKPASEIAYVLVWWSRDTTNVSQVGGHQQRGTKGCRNPTEISAGQPLILHQVSEDRSVGATTTTVLSVYKFIVAR